MDFAKNAVLATLVIRGWTASKRDDSASREVAENHGLTDGKMARVWKSLLPKNDALKRVLAVTRAARDFHYENTMPWKHHGPRILPTANFEAYTEAIRRRQVELGGVVTRLTDAFEGLKDDARRALNSMYRESDYPAVDDLRSAFSICYSIDPLPVSSTVLALEISPAEMERIRAEHEREMAETFRRANADLWERLFAALHSFHAQVRNPQKPLREATFDNLRRLLPLLERLNVTADPTLEAMRARLERALSEVTLDGLKTDPKSRFETAREADAVYSAMKSVMGVSVDAGQEYRDAA